MKTKENKIKFINNSGGTSSKMFWNLIRKNKESNSEDLYAIKKKRVKKTFNEKRYKTIHRTLLQKIVF